MSLPEHLIERALAFPYLECRACGKRILPRKMLDKRIGSEYLESETRFLRRKFCSKLCSGRGLADRKADVVIKTPYVLRALSEWREAHGLEWPYMGGEDAQVHYLMLLNEHREAA